jgi:transcriptional regulator with XRE-family HTH domain
VRNWITANQVVAHNLRRARTEAGLTQEQVAIRLEEYLGVRWSSSVFSLAERSFDEGARRREFDANDLLALSSVFERPVGWFFTPPDDAPDWVSCDDRGEATRRVGRGALRRAAEGSHVASKSLARQLREIADFVDPDKKED